MAKRNTKTKKPVEETIAPEVEFVDEPVEETEIVDETTGVADQPVVGIVSGCRLLNIRLLPDLEAPILCFVRCESDVVVDLQESSSEWLKVRTVGGVEGYCMARYVYIKR